MAPLRKPAINWKRPFTCVYGDNYAYGFNSYKDVMEWLDNANKKGYEDELPPCQMPTLEERAANHMRYKLGRSQTLLSAKARQNEEYNADPLTLRLNRLKKASGWVDERKEKRERRRAEDLASSSALRRARSYGNFASKAADEITSELAEDALGIGSRKETPKEQRARIQKRIEEDLKRDDFGATSGRVTPAIHSMYQKIGEFDDVIDSMLDLKLGSTSRKNNAGAGDEELKGCWYHTFSYYYYLNRSRSTQGRALLSIPSILSRSLSAGFAVKTRSPLTQLMSPGVKRSDSSFHYPPLLTNKSQVTSIYFYLKTKDCDRSHPGLCLNMTV